MINSVVIVGRVGQDPEVRYFDSGKVKTVLSVATNRWSKDGDKTDWFRIELWDKKAEVAGEYAKKGEVIATLYTNKQEKISLAESLILNSTNFSNVKPNQSNVVIDKVY